MPMQRLKRNFNRRSRGFVQSFCRNYSRTLAIRIEIHTAAKLPRIASALHSNATRVETAMCICWNDEDNVSIDKDGVTDLNGRLMCGEE
jgi:hypothetical protein